MKTPFNQPSALDPKLAYQHAVQVKNWLISQPEITYAAVENHGASIFAHCKNTSSSPNDAQTQEKTKLWARIFDIHYEKISGNDGNEFNTNVWKSSYNGQEIPAAEMKEWVNTTVAKILNYCSEKTNVLEIGCGNGLILSPIINHISTYVGIDSSAHALRFINESYKEKAELEKIQLFQALANDVDTLPKKKFDVIIINSVAQYFPNLDYMIDVFEKLEDYLDENSTIFIGDVRSFPLAEIFMTDILRSRANYETTKNEISTQLNRLRNKENETLYNPSFFKLLPKIFDWISSVKTELRRGSYKNEMSNYRFDVEIKCKNKNLMPIKHFVKFDWEKDQFNLHKLEQLLKGHNSSFILTNIPNERLVGAVKFNKLLQTKDGDEKINEILIASNNESGFDPEELCVLSEKYSWEHELDWDLESGLERISLSCFKGSTSYILHPTPRPCFSELSNRVSLTTTPLPHQLELKQRLKNQFNCVQEINFISEKIINLTS